MAGAAALGIGCGQRETPVAEEGSGLPPIPEASEIRIPGNQRAWLIDTVRDLRSAGLFADLAGLGDLEAARAVYRLKVISNYDLVTEFLEEGETATPDDLEIALSGLDLEDRDFARFVVAALDSSRVWWSDLEADVHPDNLVYEDVVPEWQKMSRGTLRLTDIKETWPTATGGARIDYRQDGAPGHVTTRNLQDWIDIGALCSLETDLTKAQGVTFKAMIASGQDAFVVSMRPGDERTLRRTGWKLENICDFVATFDVYLGEDAQIVDELSEEIEQRERP
jgi:hypothetical protein